MSEQSIHDRPDLLRDHVLGTLEPGAAARVAEHLRSCPDCRAEEVALQALLPLPQEALTEHERARLQRGVRAGAKEVRRGARLYQVLAGAAAVAILGALFYLGGGDEDTGRMRGAEVGAPAEALTEDSAGQAGAPLVTAIARSGDEDGGDGEAAAGGGVAEMAAGAPPAPIFDLDLGRQDRSDLTRRARREEPFVPTAAFFTAQDAATWAPAYLAALGAVAPAEVAEQFMLCVETVMQAQEGLLPIYGARADYAGSRDAVVAGFAWSNSGAGNLTDYMVWVWPRGSCDAPVEYLFGPIKAR